MQEYTLSGLDTVTPLFLVAAGIRIVLVNYIKSSMDSDPTLNFNPIAYWAPVILSAFLYEAAFTSYFIDVPRILIGDQEVIEYSKAMHDSVAQFWRVTSVLPIIPDLVGILIIIRSKSQHIGFGLSRILPISIIDLTICIGLFVYPI